MLTAEETEAALGLGYEGRGFELKGPGSPDDKHFLAKVVRASLSMGNLRDGGVVVLGITDTAPQEMLPGLSDADLAAWVDYDTISARFGEYADPPLRFDIGETTLNTGSRVVVIEVREFAEVPHLCSRSYE